MQFRRFESASHCITTAPSPFPPSYLYYVLIAAAFLQSPRRARLSNEIWSPVLEHFSTIQSRVYCKALNWYTSIPHCSYYLTGICNPFTSCIIRCTQAHDAIRYKYPLSETCVSVHSYTYKHKHMVPFMYCWKSLHDWGILVYSRKSIICAFSCASCSINMGQFIAIPQLASYRGNQSLNTIRASFFVQNRAATYTCIVWPRIRECTIRYWSHPKSSNKKTTLSTISNSPNH